MNITSQPVNMPIPTVVNQPTDALRRDNVQRELITPPAAAQQSAAEKGAASERERARTPAQQNEQIDFENIRKQAEEANSTISDEQTGNPDEGQSQNEEQAEKQATNQTDNPEESRSTEKESPEGLTQEQIAVVRELSQRDREVRTHEQAHAAAGGSTTGAPSYSFETGPDGKKYAVDGEVSVDLSPVKGDPRATITKMQKVYNAALAPAQPSIQDKRVANQASQLIAQAQSEILATSLEDPSKARTLNRVISPNASLAEENDKVAGTQDSDFDRQITKTIQAQESIAPTRSAQTLQSAKVIENRYLNIEQAYEKPPSSQFELTA